MKKKRFGFTLIEVSLFLAVTAALFVGIAAATQNSIHQQRFNDSVQNFAEFLRSVYSQVSNVQNEKVGRSDKAIYGKVVTFVADGSGVDQVNHIKSYNLIGDVEGHEVDDVTGDEYYTCEVSSSVLSRLGCLNASVVLKEEEPGHSPTYKTVGFVQDYIMRWESGLQTKDGWDSGDYSAQFKPFEGILIITHSPNSGNIFTYLMRADPTSFNYHERQELIRNIIKKIDDCETNTAGGGSCTENPFFYNEGGVNHTYLTSAFFDTNDIDFCINPNGFQTAHLRRNIRIPSGNHTASGIQVVTDDKMPSTADEATWQGNRCK